MNTQFGSYVLEEQLGAGAMGVVYRARHNKTGRRVALKVIAPGISSNDLLVARFEREMEIVQKLVHPHIVRCYETGAEVHQRFFAMELIEGGSIATLLARKGRLSWQEAIQYALQVCSALDYAHKHGIIHRDLKPANLLLLGNGALKLVDFGLALDPNATSLTAAGRTVGTVNYMAPEQIRGKPAVSPQTDLYALGCVLFEMLTGRPPFDSESPAESLFQQLKRKPPRVSSIALDCPIWLEKLILNLLEKEPLKRPPDAQSVTLALRQIQDRMAAGGSVLTKLERGARSDVLARGSSSTVHTQRSKPSRRRPAHRQSWITAVCVAIALGSLIWATWISVLRSPSRAEKRWIQSLTHSHAAVRAEAARAIAELGPAASQAVPSLIIALDDPDAEVRAGAVRALERIGPDASAAVPTLMRLSRGDHDESLRTLATQALTHIRVDRPSSGFWWPFIVAVITLAVAVAGFAWARRRFGPTAVPLLIEDLRSERVTLRRRAARILALIGPSAREAIPALLQALKDADESVRQSADLALGKIGLHNKTSVADLITALRDSDPFVRARAAVLLGKAGPAARSAIPALVSAIKDPIDLVRVEAVQSLGRVDVEATQAAPHLTEALRDKSYSVRQAAATVLKRVQTAR